MSSATGAPSKTSYDDRRRRTGERRADIPRNDAARIAWACRELRRGVAAGAIRRHLLVADGTVLELGQADALEVVVAHPGGINMTDFADAMHIDRSTATRAIDRLERLGFAERTVGADDSRIKMIHPTERGEAAIAEIVERRIATYDQLLETFGDDERALLADQLERLVDALGELVAGLES